MDGVWICSSFDTVSVPCTCIAGKSSVMLVCAHHLTRQHCSKMQNTAHSICQPHPTAVLRLCMPCRQGKARQARQACRQHTYACIYGEVRWQLCMHRGFRQQDSPQGQYEAEALSQSQSPAAKAARSASDVCMMPSGLLCAIATKCTWIHFSAAYCTQAHMSSAYIFCVQCMTMVPSPESIITCRTLAKTPAD